MRYSLRFLALLLPLFLSGCFWESNIQQIAQEETIIFMGTVTPNENSERLLEKAFKDSDVPWDADRVERIDKARNAVLGMGEYLQDRLNFDSSIPYYTNKVWFEFTSYQYMKLQVELDARVKIDGAISEEGKVIYEYVKRDIHSLLERHRVKISATEKNIEDKASADTIEEMKKIYSAIKPIVDMVL